MSRSSRKVTGEGKGKRGKHWHSLRPVLVKMDHLPTDAERAALQAKHGQLVCVEVAK